jgi:hypothetical protein
MVSLGTIKMLSMGNLQLVLSNDKFAKDNKSFSQVYNDNVKENSNMDYINFLKRYLPYYKNSTMRDLGII